MYTIDEIKEYISVLEGSSLSVLELQKEDGSKIRLERAQQIQQFVNQAPVENYISPTVQMPQTVPQPVQPAQSTAPAAEGKTINSPIVGVFYAAPSPDSEPYVTAGKKVKKGDTICIVEAMKCMNEIQAEFDCEIVDVLVNNGDLVEYGQKLFAVK